MGEGVSRHNTECKREFLTTWIVHGYMKKIRLMHLVIWMRCPPSASSFALTASRGAHAEAGVMWRLAPFIIAG